jgi:hypothetical protein
VGGPADLHRAISEWDDPRSVMHRIARGALNLIEDADGATVQLLDAEACRQVGARSLVCVPLARGSSQIGVVSVMSRPPASWRPCASSGSPTGRATTWAGPCPSGSSIFPATGAGPPPADGDRAGVPAAPPE